MTTRRIFTHEQCLIEFARELKKEARDNFRAWSHMNAVEAESRRRAYNVVFHLLKRKAEQHGIPLADLGLVDFELPQESL
ncbi:hypothetical protein [Pseudoduganella violaceinigra]|uniref:hypothetical protein n=1 Tax=Pseudoduganella violaceinigra TaxID=246602 RepID=UPI0004858057|nr:hypothetical protein [Pseudoduganella violaceinigra]